MVATRFAISVVSSGLGYHLNGVTGTLLEADRAACALRVIIPIAPARPELDDRVLGAGCVAVVAFETIAAGKTSLRLVARLLFGDGRDHLLETAYPLGRRQGRLRCRVGVTIDRQMKHIEGGKR